MKSSKYLPTYMSLSSPSPLPPPPLVSPSAYSSCNAAMNRIARRIARPSGDSLTSRASRTSGAFNWPRSPSSYTDLFHSRAASFPNHHDQVPRLAKRPLHPLSLADLVK